MLNTLLEGLGLIPGVDPTNLFNNENNMNSYFPLTATFKILTNVLAGHWKTSSSNALDNGRMQREWKIISPISSSKRLQAKKPFRNNHKCLVS